MTHRFIPTLVAVLLSLVSAPALGQEGAMRLTHLDYQRTVEYGSLSERAQAALVTAGFQPLEHRLVYAIYRGQKDDCLPVASCHCIEHDALSDHCHDGTVPMLLAATGEQASRMESFDSFDATAVLLLAEPVYGAGIPQGIYPFLGVVEYSDR